MKKFLLKFSKSKWSKVLACCMIFTVFFSMFAISSSADTTFDTATFSFSFYRGAAWVYSGANDTVLYEDGISYVSSVNFNNVSLGSYSSADDGLYYIVSVTCNFSSITINDVSYNGVLYSPTATKVSHSDSISYSFVGSSSYYNPDVSYNYWLFIPAFDIDSYNQYYIDGFNDGVDSETAKQKWYPQGYDAGYSAGLSDGMNSSASQNLGQNLIGDTLSAPIRALNEFVLFTSPSGIDVSLGMVVGGFIGLTLLLAFLRMFAGG